MSDATSGDDARGHAGSLSSMDFSTFVISLGSNALMHLGIQGDDPEGAPSEAPSEAQLELAQQTIDILAMLEDKTRGNLKDEEAELLSSVLYQVRLAFIDRNK